MKNCFVTVFFLVGFLSSTFMVLGSVNLHKEEPDELAPISSSNTRFVIITNGSKKVADFRVITSKQVSRDGVIQPNTSMNFMLPTDVVDNVTFVWKKEGSSQSNSSEKMISHMTKSIYLKIN